MAEKTKLNLYQDPDGNELIAIITKPEFELECEEDPELELIDSLPLEGNLISWPTDRLFSQDMFK